jgi:hypothetical protein
MQVPVKAVHAALYRASAFALGSDNKYSTKHMANPEALQKYSVTLCVNQNGQCTVMK